MFVGEKKGNNLNVKCKLQTDSTLETSEFEDFVQIRSGTNMRKYAVRMRNCLEIKLFSFRLLSASCKMVTKPKFIILYLLLKSKTIAFIHTLENVRCASYNEVQFHNQILLKLIS